VQVSQLGRDICAQFDETYGYVINGKTTETSTNFPVRYGIQVSLLGKREVQQRGQAHAV
jgi:hypothetical protein